MSESNAFSTWMSENPEAVNMGMGFIKGMQEDQQKAAIAQQEIAKTRYGHHLGVGPGDITGAIGSSKADRVMGGYLSGAAQRQQDEFNNKIADLLATKIAKKKPGESSTTTLSEVERDENPYHRAVTPASRAPSEQEVLDSNMQNYFGYTNPDKPTPSMTDSEIPDVFVRELGESETPYSSTRAEKRKQQLERAMAMRDTHPKYGIMR